MPRTSGGSPAMFASAVISICAFRAIPKRVEHLEVNGAPFNMFLTKPESLRDGIWYPDTVIVIEHSAASGGNDFKTERSRPVNDVHRNTGLIPINERIDNPCVVRQASQKRTDSHIGFDVNHYEMLLVHQGVVCHSRPDFRNTRWLPRRHQSDPIE